MSRLDALFLHAPRFDGSRREVMVLPLGVPALANLLARDGRTVEILHLGIEPEVDPSFSITRAIADLRPRLALVPLHFNPQTHAAIDAARRVRQVIPNTPIVLGGLTASVFARELASLPFVDAVIGGDAEEPLLRLARVILDGEGSFADVPNLTWRDSKGVHQSETRWVLDHDTASVLEHGSLRLLRHREAYVARALYADFSEGADGSKGYPFAAYLNAGRGCTSDCACCGGSASAQLLTAARTGVLLYPIDKLRKDVRDAVDDGARTLRTCFDPPEARAHIVRWFETIRAESIELRAIYDFWLPAPRAFLEDLARTFTAGSVAVFSPDCGSDAVRRRVRGYAYSNEQLLRSVAEAEDVGLSVHCFFGAGLPTETRADVDETARLIERIRRETRAAVSVTPMFIDPGSAIFRDPERFGVRLLRRGLRDFYAERGAAGGPGYETEHFTETEILGACSRLLAAAGLPNPRFARRDA